MMSIDLKTLQQQFSVPGLMFEQGPGPGHLIRALIQTPVAKGEIFLYGAHITAWQPAGYEPVLWMSKASAFELGRPIRGGVPICFPWFGAHPSDSAAPAHGKARITSWELVNAEQPLDGGIALELETTVEPFRLRFRVEFSVALKMSLTVSLPAEYSALALFEEALHTYLTVGDIHQVWIEGLETAPYLDKAGGVCERSAAGTPIRFESETDRVYQNTTAPCVLHDPILKRTVTVSKTGSESTVVWNPWIDKAARMPDFGNDEWTGMLCIETANAGAHAVSLEPGQSHTMTAVIAVSGLQ